MGVSPGQLRITSCRHRTWPDGPLAASPLTWPYAAVMGELIAEGKIGGWGQSQATVEQIRQGHAVTPITAIQSEYSIMERMFETDVIQLVRSSASDSSRSALSPAASCRERSLRTTPTAATTCAGSSPGSTETTWSGTSRCLTCCTRSRMRRGATPAQVSLAWMLHKKPFIVPIPGSRKIEHIQENLGAADIELTEEEFGRIEAELAMIEIHGNRTDEDIAKLRDLP
jgi:aryl-alcohol dehydrogenase-like predicted oxidoreductase